MENHPIPQDITGFKFKLIGSITVKQFFYLLAAALLSYMFYILPVFFVIKIPFILLFSLLGLALAFVPVDGRPLDILFLHFLKALPAENLYVYRKTGSQMLFLDNHSQQNTPQPAKQNLQKDKVATVLATTRKSQSDSEYDTNHLANIYSLFEAPHTPPPTPQPQVQQIPQPQLQTLPSTQPITASPIAYPQESPLPVVGMPTMSSPSQQASYNTHQGKPDTSFVRILAQQGEDEVKIAKPTPPPVVKEEKKDQPKSEAITEEVNKELSTMEKEIHKEDEDTVKFEQLEKQFEQMGRQRPQEPVRKIEQKQPGSAAPVAPQNSVNAGFPTIPDVPNIIMGILRDPRGRILPNMLVEVMDKNQIPVRAFKTNGLGQFASATPLPNGVYTIRFEDPSQRNEFEAVEVTLNGSIFQPIEVISMDERERLRRSLFDQNS